MGVPKCLVRLLPYSGVSGGEHQEHAEEHDMSGNATGFCIVYLDGRHRSELFPFNIVKAVFRLVFFFFGMVFAYLLDIMCGYVDNGPEQQ